MHLLLKWLHIGGHSADARGGETVAVTLTSYSSTRVIENIPHVTISLLWDSRQICDYRLSRVPLYKARRIINRASTFIMDSPWPNEVKLL
jgi:hypothetical protein